MATNWRLTNKEIAIIAHALQHIEEQDIENVFGFNKLNASEIRNIKSRFTQSAMMHEETTHKTANVTCKCRDCC